MSDESREEEFRRGLVESGFTKEGGNSRVSLRKGTLSKPLISISRDTVEKTTPGLDDKFVQY